MRTMSSINGKATFSDDKEELVLALGDGNDLETQLILQLQDDEVEVVEVLE
jgi:hypothetical protein